MGDVARQFDEFRAAVLSGRCYGTAMKIRKYALDDTKGGGRCERLRSISVQSRRWAIPRKIQVIRLTTYSMVRRVRARRAG